MDLKSGPQFFIILRSHRRGYEFVSRKITSHGAKIKLGLAKETQTMKP